METIDVQRKRSGSVVEITLDDPPLNILDLKALEELVEAFGGLQDDSDLAAIVVSANGDAFSAGADIGDHLPGVVETMIPTFHEVFRKMWSLDVPTVASVQGRALGGGMELAIGCDFIVATQDALFGQPEIKVGVFPPVASLLLPRRIPWSRALELIVTGDNISAPEAQRLGIVNRIVEPGALAEATDEFVGSFAASSPPVVRLAKRAARRGRRRADTGELLRALDDIESMYLDELMELDDPEEGLRAFMENRKPEWKGR